MEKAVMSRRLKIFILVVNFIGLFWPMLSRAEIEGSSFGEIFVHAGYRPDYQDPHAVLNWDLKDMSEELGRRVRHISVPPSLGKVLGVEVPKKTHLLKIQVSVPPERQTQLLVDYLMNGIVDAYQVELEGHRALAQRKLVAIQNAGARGLEVPLAKLINRWPVVAPRLVSVNFTKDLDGNSFRQLTRWAATIIFPLVVLLGLTIRSVQLWGPSSPAFIFSSFWLFILLLHQFLAFDVSAGQTVLWFVAVLATVAFLFNSVVLTLVGSPDFERPYSVSKKNTDINFLVLLGLGIMSVGLCLIGIKTSGNPLSVLSSAREFSEMAANNATARYRGYPEPIPFRLAQLGALFSAALCGYLFWTFNVAKRLCSTLAFVAPAIFLTAILTTKASVLFPAIIFISTSIASAVFLGRSFAPTWIQGVSLVIISLVCFCGFAVVQMMRYSLEGLVGFVEAANRLRLDFFGFIGPFGHWFDAYLTGFWNDQLSLGALTFAGPFNLLGLKIRESGIYQESVSIGTGHMSNIYSMFRGLLDDFGFTITLLIMGLIFSGATVAWCGIRNQRRWALPVYSGFVLTVFWSHIVFAFSYNTIIATWLLSTGVLLFIRL